MKPFSMLRRVVSGVALVSVGVMAIGVLPAAAAATLGQAVTDGLACASGGFSAVQGATAKGVPSYSVPKGVTEITSWSTQAGADGGTMALEIWQPTPSMPQLYTLVGISPTETLTPSTLNTFLLASPIAVTQGDVLGFYVTNTTDCTATVSGPATDLALGTFSEASPPAVGTQVGFGQTLWGDEWDISAVGVHHLKA